MLNKVAFIDESGAHGFNFEADGVSTHFILAAVIVGKEDLPDAEAKAEEVRKKFFQTGQIKSSKAKLARRKKVLAALKEIPFTSYVFVVDKRKLYGEGLIASKGTFFKYLNKRLYRSLHSVFPELKIAAANYEGEKFMSEFVRYVEREIPRDLFNQSEFEFVHIGESILNQVADFIAGTVAQHYEAKVGEEDGADLMKQVLAMNAKFERWPTDPIPPLPNPVIDNTYDSTIAYYSLKLVDDFIARHPQPDSQRVKDQVSALNFLRFYFKAIDPLGYVHTAEIVENLNAWRVSPIDEKEFRSKVIAPLRDEGILIASSSGGGNQGLKLPANVNDLNAFVLQTHQQVSPMLSRLKRCVEQVMLVTNGNVDLLKHPQYGYMQRIFEDEAVIT